jgi:hypothetical protein
MKRLNWGFALFPLVLASCASLVRPATLHNPSSDTWKDSSALVLGLRFEGPEEAMNKGDCSLRLVEVEKDLYFETKFPAVDSTLFVDLPAGKYRGDEIQCAYYYKWQIKDAFGDMVVENGKVSYGGSFTFRFHDEGKKLSVAASNRQKTLEHLAESFRSTHPTHRTRWIAAYTGRPITSAMVQESGSGVMRIQATWLKGEKYSIQAAADALSKCDTEADFQNDLVRVGSMKITANYKPNEEPSVEVDAKNSALPLSYEKCLSDALRNFRSPGNLKIELKF